MTTVLLASALGSLSQYTAPQISADLAAHSAWTGWPPAAPVDGGTASAITLTRVAAQVPARTINTALAQSYVDDFYYRVHVMPASIDLGNLVSEQTRAVDVWNAWPDRSLSLVDIVVDPDSAIIVSGQAAPPLSMNPLQELTWQLSVGVSGAPVIDTAVQWVFAGLDPIAVRITGNRVTAWTWVPNWSAGVKERLEWLTLLEKSASGDETATPLREWPRRSWEFTPLAEGTARQRMEAMLYDASSRTWSVPVWPDITQLDAALPAGVLTIPVDTAALDYHVGGLAMLLSGPATFEVVEVDTVTPTAITLARATVRDWPVGTQLYPARAVRLDAWPTLNRYTTRLVDTAVRFVSTDANDHAAALPLTLYRGVPVLEDRPEWSDNPTASYGREITLIDNAVGPVLVDDVTGLPWPTQSQRWQVYGRAEHDTLRSLLYGLAGKANRIWLPTWQCDLYPQATMAGTLLDVAHCGYTVYLHGQPGRRDIRVQLVDGTVLYRRITGSVELDETTERLQVDTA